MSGSLAQTLRGKGRVVLPDAGKVGGVDGVTVDALVVLKILKHARENPHEAVMGPLLGLVVGRNLEVTNCFPFPRSTEEETEESRAQDMQYQFEMMRCLREVNVDHLQVGLYHSARMGAYFSEELVQTQYEHQTEIEESVVLIYDPEQVEQGQLSIKAFRLTDRFIKTFKGGDFSVAGLKKSGLTYDGIFEEVAVTLKTSHLGLAAIDTMKASGDETQLFDSLDLSTNQYLGKNIRLLMDCIDDLSNETQKYAYYQRQLSRQQQQQQQYLQRRNLENARRAEEGQPPLPEEDTSNNPIFKTIPAPSRLESLLVTGQMAQYCKQISHHSSQNFSKLFAASGVQGVEQ